MDKIAYVCPRFPPYIGGVETHVYEISKRISKHFDVEILTTDPGGKLPKVEIIENLTVRRFKAVAPSGAYYFSLDLYRFLKRNSKKYAIIHFHNYHSLTSFLSTISKSKHNKVIFTPHYHGKAHSLVRNLLIHLYHITLGKKIFAAADKVICVSEYEKSLVLRKFKVEKKLEVIPNGIDLEQFRKIKNVKKDEKTILYVGRLEKYKGVQYIIQALKYLNDWKLIIVGSGGYEKRLIELAKNLNVSNKIKFLKNLPKEELIRLYKRSSVFVLLSKYEAYGITVAESLLAGTPCIVAKSSALIEWIDNKNVFGLSLPVNPKELAKAIENVSPVKVRLSKKLKSKILSWDDVAKKHKKMYLKVLE